MSVQMQEGLDMNKIKWFEGRKKKKDQRGCKKLMNKKKKKRDQGTENQKKEEIKGSPRVYVDASARRA